MIPIRRWSLLLTRLSNKGLLIQLTKRETKTNVVGKAITSTISEKKNINTFNKTDKSQASNKTVDTSKSNKTETFKSIDKSRSTQISDTLNTADKSGSIIGTNLSNISTRIVKPTEIYIVKDNNDLYGLSLHGDNLAGITPDIIFIP